MDRLDYTNAVLQESLRLTGLAYNSVPHEAMTDFDTTNGHRVPKGTMLFLDIYSIMHDPAVFEDPDAFKPERFLNDKGQFTGPHDHVIPFGVGRRTCLGQSLAEKQLLLFFVGFMQQFDFESYGTLPNYDPLVTVPNFLRDAPAFKIKLIKRISN